MNSKLCRAALFFLAGISLASCMQIDQGAGANLVITSNQGLDFGNVVLGTNLSVSFLIKNEGLFDATKVSIPPVTAPYSLSTSDCSTTLPVGATCTLTISFTPAVLGEADLSLPIQYFNGATTLSGAFSFTGVGVNPTTLELTDENPYVFTPSDSGSSSHTFTLENKGLVAATSISFGSITAPFSITQNNCTDTLLAGATCQFQVTYTSDGFSCQALDISYGNGLTSTDLVLYLEAGALPE